MLWKGSWVCWSITWLCLSDPPHTSFHSTMHPFTRIHWKYKKLFGAHCWVKRWMTNLPWQIWWQRLLTPYNPMWTLVDGLQGKLWTENLELSQELPSPEQPGFIHATCSQSDTSRSLPNVILSYYMGGSGCHWQACGVSCWSWCRYCDSLVTWVRLAKENLHKACLVPYTGVITWSMELPRRCRGQASAHSSRMLLQHPRTIVCEHRPVTLFILLLLQGNL